VTLTTVTVADFGLGAQARAGQGEPAAMKDDTVDKGWSYDFGRLYELACPSGEKIG
jgi:hypothetical protein